MITALYNEEQPLNGIFNKLEQENKLNYIHIFGKKHDTCQNQVDVLYDDNKKPNTYWFSTKEDPYLLFQFQYPILLTSYTLEAAGEESQKGHSYPSKWILNGYSPQTEKWEQIDYQENQIFCNTETNGCKEPTSKNYNTTNHKNIYTQLNLTSLENSMGSNHKYLILSSVEFFGSLHIMVTYESKRYLSFSILLYTMIFL